MKKVAVILSGCGVYDGAEIHEAVFTLLCIEQAGGSYQCFAPDISQLHVINHLTGEELKAQSRNVLIESARIARGDVLPLNECKPDEFDMVVVPGGFGVAKNLCNFAVAGKNCEVNSDVFDVCKSFAEKRKPSAYACISPALAAKIYGKETRLTVGNDEGAISEISALGATHIECNVDEVLIDEHKKLVTTPAYMLANSISEAYVGIDKMIRALFALS